MHHNSSAAIDIVHLREPGLAPSLGVVEIHEEGEDARPLRRPHRRVLVRVRARVRARVRVWARVRARVRVRVRVRVRSGATSQKASSGRMEERASPAPSRTWPGVG